MSYIELGGKCRLIFPKCVSQTTSEKIITSVSSSLQSGKGSLWYLWRKEENLPSRMEACFFSHLYISKKVREGEESGRE